MKALTKTTISFAATATPGTDDLEAFIAKCTEKLRLLAEVGWAMGLPIDIKIDVSEPPTDQPALTEAMSALKTRQYAAFNAILRANPDLGKSGLAKKLNWARTFVQGIVSETPTCFITKKRLEQIVAARDAGSIQCPDEAIQALHTIANRRG